MSLTMSDLIDVLKRRGQTQYGMEAVSQLEHALQCAQWAEKSGETDETVVACLLHDLGHLIAAERDHLIDHDTSVDDLHQYIALPFLRSLFPSAVLEPIRLHVDAKRYLCWAEPSYWEGLSPASQISLEQQGGVFNDEQAQAFLALPFAEESIRLRRYDDRAKVPNQTTPDLAHFAALMTKVNAQCIVT